MADWDDTYQVATKHNATINTGTGTVDSFADTEGRAVEWRYTVDNGSGTNMRTGVIRAVFDTVADSAPVQTPDRYSDSIGTVSITFSVDKSGNSVRLRATVTTDGWRVDVIRMLIGAE
jgi:L-rhamnose isomerase